jgi:hypothetical protein
MSTVIKPLHVATIRGHQLRFFRTPNNDGRPDLHWHCVDDLWRCMGLSREQRRIMQHKMKEPGPFRNSFRTIATSDGLVTIAPHFIAQVITSTWRETGSANIETEYALAGAEALQKLTAHLSFPEEVLPWTAAALNRHEAAP